MSSFSVRSQNHTYKNSIVFRLARHLCSSTSLVYKLTNIPDFQLCYPVSVSLANIIPNFALSTPNTVSLARQLVLCLSTNGEIKVRLANVVVSQETVIKPEKPCVFRRKKTPRAFEMHTYHPSIHPHYIYIIYIVSLAPLARQLIIRRVKNVWENRCSSTGKVTK